MPLVAPVTAQDTILSLVNVKQRKVGSMDC